MKCWFSVVGGVFLPKIKHIQTLWPEIFCQQVSISDHTGKNWQLNRNLLQITNSFAAVPRISDWAQIFSHTKTITKLISNQKKRQLTTPESDRKKEPTLETIVQRQQDKSLQQGWGRNKRVRESQPNAQEKEKMAKSYQQLGISSSKLSLPWSSFWGGKKLEGKNRTEKKWTAPKDCTSLLSRELHSNFRSKHRCISLSTS